MKYVYDIGENCMKENLIFARKNLNELVKELTFSNIVEHSINLFVSVEKELELGEKSFEDKVKAYQEVWKATINTLYEQEIQGEKNRYEIGIEWTPYTICIAEQNNYDLVDFFNLSDEDKEFCEDVYKKPITETVVVNKNANFILCILIMPPLISIADFYARAYEHHIRKAQSILSTVQNNIVEMPDYRCNIGLELANNFIDQKIYRKYGGMNGLLKNNIFEGIRKELLEIKEECGESKKLPQKAICPYCGKQHDIIVHKDDIFYAHLLLLHKDVLKKLGLIVMDDYRELFLTSYLSAITEIEKHLNDVKNVKCYILVEGDTEEKAIPYMALKYGKPLAYRGIKVWNSKTKQKVYMDFEKFIKNNPDIKICVLLDGDARKEIDNIERIIKEKKNQYVLHYIPNGTFEDIIDKDIAVYALNSIYGSNIFVKNDFDGNKPFLNQVKKKISMNSELGEFDKIQFIETVMKLTTQDNIPDIIKRVIDDCYKLVD